MRVTSSQSATLRLLALLLLAVMLLAGQPAAATSDVQVINKGNPLSSDEVSRITAAAQRLPIPVIVYVSNDFSGAKVDFSRIIAKYVTQNNVVVGINLLKRSDSENYRYRLVGAGPKSGLSTTEINAAQDAGDRYLRASGGPQASDAVLAILTSVGGSLSGSGGVTNPDTVDNTTAPAPSGGGLNWGLIITVLLVAALLFFLVRWLIARRQTRVQAEQGAGYSAQGKDVDEEQRRRRGDGYDPSYGGGGVGPFIWLGGPSYGGGNYGGDGGGNYSGGTTITPPANVGGSSFDAPGGNGGDVMAGVLQGGRSDGGSDSRGGSSFDAPSGSGGNALSGNISSAGTFAGIAGASAASGGSSFDAASVAGGAASSVGGAAAGQAAGAIAEVAINILGGIVGAIFSSGSSGSGPDF